MKKSIKAIEQQLTKSALLNPEQQAVLKGGYIIVSDTDII